MKLIAFIRIKAKINKLHKNDFQDHRNCKKCDEKTKRKNVSRGENMGEMNKNWKRDKHTNKISTDFCNLNFTVLIQSHKCIQNIN